MDVYVMADEKMVVHQQTVHLRDIAKIYCVLPEVSDRLNAIEVCDSLNKKHSQQVIDLYELLCSRLTENPDIAPYAGSPRGFPQIKTGTRKLLLSP